MEMVRCIVLYLLFAMVQLNHLLLRSLRKGRKYFGFQGGSLSAGHDVLSLLDTSMSDLERREWLRCNTKTVVEGFDGRVLCLSLLGSVYLWSPTSFGISKKLPPSPAPRRTGYRVGLGRDPLSGDLKVVMVCGSQPTLALDGSVFNVFTRDTRAWVHSSSTNCWRSIPVLLDLDHVVSGWTSLNCSPLVNGCLHWSLQYSSNTQESRTAFQLAIVSFDLSTEAFQLITPPSRMIPRINRNLSDGVSKLYDCLSILSHCRRQNSIRIWVMKRYGVSTSWTDYLNLNLASVEYIIPRQFSKVTLANSGYLVISCHWTKGLFCYNLNTQAVQHFTALDAFARNNISNFVPYLFNIYL